MDFFSLPKNTYLGKVIPKNSFDKYTNTKQQKLFSDFIKRITWLHKLSEETINLPKKEIQEIQIFKIELKQKERIDDILSIINKAIPYHIIFQIQYEDSLYLSTSAKHANPQYDNISVIDWTFTSDWFNKKDKPYQLNLRYSLDRVFVDLCTQMIGQPNLLDKSLPDIIQREKTIQQLERKITQLKSAISKCKQFNKKIELNLKLKKLEKEFLRLF